MTQKVTLKEMFEDYAKREKEFLDNSEPGKLYHRILPNIKDKKSAYVDFLYNRIIVGGVLHDNELILNKLKLCNNASEDDIEPALAEIEKVVSEGDLTLVNELK